MTENIRNTVALILGATPAREHYPILFHWVKQIKISVVEKPSVPTNTFRECRRRRQARGIHKRRLPAK